MKSTTVRGALRAMSRLLADRQRWIKGAVARPHRRSRIYADPSSKEATCFCLIGAVVRCTAPRGKVRSRTITVLENAIGKYLAERPRHALNQHDQVSIGGFNDYRGTRHEHVLDVIRYAERLVK